MSFLVTSPMAVYQLTRLQQEIVKPLKLQQDLHEGYMASPACQNNSRWQKQPYYETYVNWCKTKGYEVGTKVPPLSTIKVQAIITSFYAINLIKHPLGCLESIARVPFSALTFIAQAVVSAPLINRVFPIEIRSNLKEFNRHLGSPVSNIAHAVSEFFISFFYIFGSISHRLKSDFSREEGDGQLAHLCQHELAEMTGDKLWQIYASISDPDFRNSY